MIFCAISLPSSPLLSAQNSQNRLKTIHRLPLPPLFKIYNPHTHTPLKCNHKPFKINLSPVIPINQIHPQLLIPSKIQPPPPVSIIHPPSPRKIIRHPSLTLPPPSANNRLLTISNGFPHRGPRGCTQGTNFSFK